MARQKLSEKEIDIILEGDVSEEDDDLIDDEAEYDDILQAIQRQIEGFDEEDDLQDELELAGEQLE